MDPMGYHFSPPKKVAQNASTDTHQGSSDVVSMQVPMTLLYARDNISHCKLLSKPPKNWYDTPENLRLEPKITQLKRKII